MSGFLKNSTMRISLLSILISGSCYSALEVDLIIRNAHILSIDSNKTVYENGSIVVRGDTIVAIGGENLEQDYLSDTVIDAGGDIVVPGIIIVDVHATNMQPAYDPYADLAFSAYPENVRTTIVNGAKTP